MCAKAESLGAQIHLQPMDIEPGRIAVIADPQNTVSELDAA